ncbi:SAICAR synthase-like protein [Wilcoxina mikolae CBS 423.85]|nr:SAICAR synthase-like protein [Wilcoxina mikolae CBS 423.85]
MPTPPPGTDASYFPPHTNGSAVHSTKPSSIPVSINSTTKPVEHLQQPYSHPGSPPTRLSPPIPPMGSPAAGSSSQAQQQQPLTGSLRQRHTLQVPKPQQGSRTSTPASGSEVVASGRFSPTTSATTPRRQSMTLGRRPTRSIHSDNHLEEIPPDEDAARWTEAIKAKRASRRRKDEEGEDDKVVVGTKVDHNHVNWVTAYNMLTGIRFCVSRINAKMDRELTDADFDAKHKFSFDVTGNELTPSAKYDFKFKDYSPWVFRHLRAKFGLDPGDYLMSLTSKYILSELGSPGKSGSFFYFSRDYKYIIKTIHHGEHRFLRHILRDYYKHIEDNPNTLISQFYGLHRVKTPFGRKIHFVVMNNLFPPHRDIHQTFDLKGSTIGRDYKEDNLAENPRATLKDLNWIRRDMHLNFGPYKKALFIEQVERDVKLLQKLEIMDYSLLLGIHDLTRGNKDDIRNSALKVFGPGSGDSDDIHGHMLQRTPSKMEKARQARELRRVINNEVPVALDRSVANRLPDEFSEQKNTVFYGDDGGFRATHENDQPGDVIYYLGIIDCLTHYGFVKRLEHFWRGLSHPKDQVSAIPPLGYGERFFNFISSIVKSPEDAAREKEARNNAAASSESAAAEHDTDPAERTTARSEDIDNAPHRTIAAVRSPSAERTGGASGTILPVVEEAGEGSSSGRSRNGSARSTDGGGSYEGAPMMKSDSGLGQPTSMASTTTTMRKVEPQEETLAIRVTRVRG